MRYFAHSLPGLGGILADEVVDHTGAGVDVSTDGRADVAAFEAREVPVLRCAEDVFVEVATSRGTADPRRLASALLDPDGLERALSVYAGVAGGLRARMGFRVAVRVASEEGFRRTDLRRALHETVSAQRPRWREADPADIELWVHQTGSRWRSGIRLTGGKRSRRSSRQLERAGALRPSVAAAMVRLAGAPRGWLLDPFCGTGTVLIEAAVSGWQPVGSDIDERATPLASVNASAPVAVADARALPLEASTAAAVASNLPFGKRFELPGRPVPFVRGVLEEIRRVSKDGADVALLAPRTVAEAMVTTAGIESLDRWPIVLLGEPTVLWRLRCV